MTKPRTPHSPCDKIQKVLAQQGIASRRTIESWIREGRITVNQQPAQIGQRIDLSAVVSIDGKRIRLQAHPPERRVLLYHKPAGEICSRHDPQGRPTVFDRLPKLKVGRWLSIGRLDFNTSGLLLITNDGSLANTLMHPNAHLEREYAVRIYGHVDDTILRRLTQTVELPDGPARFEHIVDGGGEGRNHWYYVVTMVGRNRIVRRLWASQGVTVSRLIRVRYGPIKLPPRLTVGHWEPLSLEAIAALRQTAKTQMLSNPPSQ